ncbi:MAG: hypothetical protein IID37_05120 [Planctomycetes bacterium]|nr:hypothetical protein [Planctomycetota bacterium]
MSNKLMSRFLVALLLAFLASPVSAGERSYTFYNIFYPFCGFDPMTEATDVNDSGVVTGYFLTEDCTQVHGITWINGVMTDLDDTYPDGVFRGAQAISRDGVILGTSFVEEVLVLRDDVVEPLPVPPGCEEHEVASDMNDAGTMAVGSCDRNGSGLSVPSVYWIDEGISLALDLLPGLPDDATGEARGVNDAGVVIAKIDGEARAYTWIDGEITEIPNLVGGTGIGVSAINNHNLIVGEAEVEDGSLPAMSYDLNTGVMTILGPGRADAVNDRGSAVGLVILDFTDVHAMLYEGGEAIDLSPFFPAVLADDAGAEAINNYGWIVGCAEEWGNGPLHGWLLVPEYDKGDYDGDTDVDHQDFQHFQRCFAAEPYPNGMLHVGCSVFDFDDDVDLDLEDYAAFQSAFTGPTAPNNNPNGPG